MSHITRHIFEVALLIALIVGLVSLLRQPTPNDESPQTALLPDSYPAPASPSPLGSPTPRIALDALDTDTEESTATPTQTTIPPLCQFDAQAPPTPEAVEIIFSKPEVVLTSESLISVVQWVSEQRLLITRRIPKQSREVVEIFNIQTKESQSYGERTHIAINDGSKKPVWLESLQAVAFVDFAPDNQLVLKISRGREVSNTSIEGIGEDGASTFVPID